MIHCNNTIYIHLFIKTVITALLGLVQVLKSKLIIIFNNKVEFYCGLGYIGAANI